MEFTITEKQRAELVRGAYWRGFKVGAGIVCAVVVAGLIVWAHIFISANS